MRRGVHGRAAAAKMRHYHERRMWRRRRIRRRRRNLNSPGKSKTVAVKPTARDRF